jgi:DNA-binding LacI/PurR family transcriptional regulator
MLTVKDVAKAAGVSVATVSRALRNEGYVSEKSRLKVLRTAAEIGYTPDLNAKSLRSGKSNAIGVIVSDLSNNFYSIVLSRLEQELKSLGYVMLLAHSNENSEEEATNINLMLRSRVDGIIFTPVTKDNQGAVDAAMRHRIPLLQLYRNAYPEVDSVVVDDEFGAYLATTYLIEQGHRRILLLGVKSDISPSRTSGYFRAFYEHGLQADTSLAMELPPNADFTSQLHAMFPKGKAAPGIDITAIVAGTNGFGYEAVMYFNEVGISIPEDISMVVFDDVSWVSITNMAVIRQPVDSIAFNALQIMMSRINSTKSSKGPGGIAPIKIKVEPVLKKRKSVKSLS